MKWNELKELVIAEYDRRNLKSNVRYRALDKVDAFIKEKRPEMMSDVHASFPSDKDTLKKAYEAYKGKQINSAESSAINEIYNQLNC